MSESKQNQAASASTTTSVAVIPAPYTKLIADCWENIFDYLPLKDVISMGNTCKRMQRMVGFYFREYYQNLKWQLCRDTITSQSNRKLCLGPEFFQYINTLYIDRTASIHSFEQFSALKTIIFTSVDVNSLKWDDMKSVLANIENITIEFGNGADEFLSHVAVYCTQLKSLRIKRAFGESKIFFSLHFVALEYLEFVGTNHTHLKTFLERHTNLRHFKCYDFFLFAIQDVLLCTNIQLDLLTINTTQHPLNQIVDCTNALYERGFYKTLQCKLCAGHLDDAQQYGSIVSTFSSLTMIRTVTELDIDLTYLTNLRELHIFEWSGSDMEAIAKSLTKLERLSFCGSEIYCILPFIRHSAKLKSIKIDYSEGIVNQDDFDLFTLNEERKKLAEAQQILLCVPEPQYLITKWNARNSNLSHLRITRTGSKKYY